LDKKKHRILSILILITLFSMPMRTAAADQTGLVPTNTVAGTTAPDPAGKTPPGFEAFLADHASFRMDLLSYGILRDPVDDSVLNAGNRLGISTREAVLSVRPDISLDLDRWHLSVKPRWSLAHQKWTRGFQDGRSDTSEKAHVNEWQARVMVTQALFISYGRENLQWGPSYLISPSNPFIRDNGRDNPKTEVGGLEYARVLWIPHADWSVSFISNLDDGAYAFFSPFNRKHAVKIDYTGFEKYGSVIFSHEESGPDFLGLFAGWSYSDAVLLYGETGVNTNRPGPSGGTDLDLLLGVSYTFKAGPTLACEYFYNENGKTSPIHLAFLPPAPADPDDVLIRKNYGMLQLSEFKIKDRFNYVLRWILNLDDHSNRLIGILEYELTDRWKVFGIGDLFNGGRDDEFGFRNNYSVYAGVQWSY
jgi:hypothetical protein